MFQILEPSPIIRESSVTHVTSRPPATSDNVIERLVSADKRQVPLMIKFNAAPKFDFDEWATLYQRDPAAFEARRKALLAIEIARGGKHANAAKAMIERLDSQLEGKSDAERARLSLLAMVASAKQMTDRLTELSEQMKDQARRFERRKPQP